MAEQTATREATVNLVCSSGSARKWPYRISANITVFQAVEVGAAPTGATILRYAQLTKSLTEPLYVGSNPSLPTISGGSRVWFRRRSFPKGSKKTYLVCGSRSIVGQDIANVQTAGQNRFTAPICGKLGGWLRGSNPIMSD